MATQPGTGDLKAGKNGAGDGGARTPEQSVEAVVMAARELRQIVGKMRDEEDIAVLHSLFADFNKCLQATGIYDSKYHEGIREFLCDDSLAVLARSVLRMGRKSGWDFGNKTSPACLSARLFFGFCSYIKQVPNCLEELAQEEPDIFLDAVIPLILSQGGFGEQSLDECHPGLGIAYAYRHVCTVILTASDVNVVRKAYFGDNRKWMEGVKSVLPKLFAEDRTALRSEEWEQRIRTITTVLDLRTSRAFQRMHYIWRPHLTGDEQAQLDSRTLVKPMAKVAHRLYEFCEPFLVRSHAKSPPTEIEKFYRALLDTITWVVDVEFYVIAGAGFHPTPSGWRLRFGQLCNRIAANKVAMSWGWLGHREALTLGQQVFNTQLPREAILRSRATQLETCVEYADFLSRRKQSKHAHVCLHCYTPCTEREFSRCAKCRVATECQAANWPHHKKICIRRKPLSVALPTHPDYPDASASNMDMPD